MVITLLIRICSLLNDPTFTFSLARRDFGVNSATIVMLKIPLFGDICRSKENLMLSEREFSFLHVQQSTKYSGLSATENDESYRIPLTPKPALTCINQVPSRVKYKGSI